MTLYLIGIGLNDEKDISVKGLELVKKCKEVYLESYTSKLQCSKEDLENLYGKDVIVADREMVEKKAEEIILKNAKDSDVAFLVVGDVFGATTHTDLMLRAKKTGIKVEVVHNASIISAIGITGLEVYKFGKITSIPFDNENIKAPYDVFLKNFDNGLHTLFLFDLNPSDGRYLTIKDALKYLEKQGLKKDTKIIGCARIGSTDPMIKYGKVDEVKEVDFGDTPYCLILPAKLHFMEEEFLEQNHI